MATQAEIAAAFGHSVATQRRWETRYRQHGSDGLQAHTPTGRPGKLDRGQQVFVERINVRRRCWTGYGRIMRGRMTKGGRCYTRRFSRVPAWK